MNGETSLIVLLAMIGVFIGVGISAIMVFLLTKYWGW